MTTGGGGALVSYMNINKAKIWVIRSIARKLKKQRPWMYICMLVDNQVIHESRKCPITFSWLVNSNAPPPPPAFPPSVAWRVADTDLETAAVTLMKVSGGFCLNLGKWKETPQCRWSPWEGVSKCR